MRSTLTGGGGGGGGWTTSTGGGGGVSPFWACIKHPHPLKTNPTRTSITKIPANFVFINPSSFYLVGTSSKSQTAFTNPRCFESFVDMQVCLSTEPQGVSSLKKYYLPYDTVRGIDIILTISCLVSGRYILASPCPHWFSLLIFLFGSLIMR